MNNYPYAVVFLDSVIKKQRGGKSPESRALVAGAQAVLAKVVPGYKDPNSVPLWSQQGMEVLQVLASAYAHELSGLPRGVGL